MAPLIYEYLVTSNKEAFLAKVRAVSSRLGIDPNWLMAVMYKESRINPAAVNPVNGASGLIQFIRSTARSLGTTVEQIRVMSNVDQLDLVERYYQPYRSRIKSAIDLYLATFFPIAIGKPDNWVLQASGIPASLIAAQNAGLDYDKDRDIEVGEVKRWFFAGMPQNVVDLLQKKNGPAGTNPSVHSAVCPHCGKHLVSN